MTRDRWIAAICLCIGAVLSIPLIIMFWDRDPPSIVTEVAVDADQVEPGGDLVILYSVRRERDCGQNTERTLYDGEGEQYRLDPSTRLSSGLLGSQSYRRVVKVPASAAPGHAKYRVVSAYHCNVMHWFWPIVQVVADVDFWIVVPPEVPKPRPP